jgi:hypothetical protein
MQLVWFNQTNQYTRETSRIFGGTHYGLQN